MTKELQEKLAKIYALVQHGGTEGEKAAAKHQLDKILKKYNLEGINLETLDRTDRDFHYTTQMEIELFSILLKKFLSPRRIKKFSDAKGFRVPCTHLEWVELSCAYEYFRRHMKVQWNLVCLPEVNKKRKAKTKNARRKELQESFSARYFFLSGLYDSTQVREIPASELSEKELRDAQRMANVEGGKLTKQVQTGHQLPPVSLPKQQGQLSIF